MRHKFNSLLLCAVCSVVLSACGSRTEPHEEYQQQATEKFAVHFNSNGGTPIETQWVLKGDKVKKPENPEKNGYSFKNWTYQNEEWSFIGYVVTEDMTLDANWNVVTYSISYNYNGGNLVSNPTTYTIEDTKSINSPIRDGYTFVGWTDQNGNPFTSVQPGMYGDLSLTANWSINSYNVIVTSSNTTRGNVAGSGTYQYGSNVTIQAFPNTGYQFSAWYSNYNYVSGNAVYTFTLSNSDISLSADFYCIYYSISYALNGGTNYQYNPTSYTIEQSSSLSPATKDGYTFLYWTDQNGNIISSIQPGMYGNLTLTANWSINNYNVSVTSSDNTKGSVTGSGSYQYHSNVTINASPNTGYRFDGWYQNSQKVSSNQEYTFVLNSSDVSFEARWGIISYSISYVLNGGTSTGNNPTSYTIESENTLYQPFREGYTFTNWTDQNGNIINSIQLGMYGNLTLTANWSINNYNVVVTSRDVTKGTVTGSGAYQYQSQVTVIATPNNGYKFNGWYNNSSKVSNYSTYTFTLGSSDVALEARWSPISYSITYQLGGGTNNVNNPISYTIEDEISLFEGTRTGYNFINWTNQDGDVVSTIQRGTYGNLVLTANWAIGYYSVSVNCGNKGTATGVGTFEYQSSTTLTAIPNAGYVFNGWYKDGVLVSQDNPYVYTIPSSNAELTVEWTKAEYTIQYEYLFAYDDGTTKNIVDLWVTTTITNNNPLNYDIESEFLLSDPVLNLGTFVCWKDQSGNIIAEIEPGTYGDLVLTAWFSPEHITITLVNSDPSKGSISGGGTYQFEQNVQIKAFPNEGYTVKNWVYSALGSDDETWYSGGDLRFSWWSGPSIPRIKDCTLKVNWGLILYNIQYNLEGGKLITSCPNSYHLESSFTLPIPVKYGCSFVNWTDQSGHVISEIQPGMTGDLELTAHWSYNSYSVNISSNDVLKGTVSGGGTFMFGSSVTVSCEPQSGYDFLGWYADDTYETKLSLSQEYTFNLEEEGLNLYAKFGDSSEKEAEETAWTINHAVTPQLINEGAQVKYGLYPQSHVNNQVLINRLNSQSTINEAGYYQLANEYYLKCNTLIDFNGYEFKDGSSIEKDQEYWFRCEPIVWDILDNNSGECLLFSNLVLDNKIYQVCQSYDSTQYYYTDYQGESGYGYQNNYKYSLIRTFLNTEFYEKAFFLNNTYVETTEVDNGQSSSAEADNPCVCENTSDKVFLLSSKDLTSTKYGFIDDSENPYHDGDLARRRYVSDFALANGAKYKLPGQAYASYVANSDYDYCAAYWTRTPPASMKFYGGFIYNNCSINGYILPVNCSVGVCPSITLNLNP